MKIIEVDDQLYQYIASKTENIGEQASDILRRLLGFEPLNSEQQNQTAAQPSEDEQVAEKTEELIEVVIPAEQKEHAKIEDAVQQEDTQDVDKTQDVVKTTTLKKQEAIHQQLNTEADISAEKSNSSEKVTKPKAAATKKPQKSRIVKGLSKEQLAAPVSGLDLPELAEQSNVVKRFLYILDCLHQTHQTDFNKILEVQGRDRLYFATSEQALRGSGSSTNPKQIGTTGYWVLTNSNTDRKRWMLAEVAKLLGYSQSDIDNLKLKL